MLLLPFFLTYSFAQRGDFDNDQWICEQPGKKVQITAVEYYCGNMRVSKEEYIPGVCTVQSYQKDVCICPADYYGKFCQAMRFLVCDIDQVFPDEQNCDDYGIEYNRDMQGHPNCFQANKKDIVELQFKANCRSQYFDSYISQEWLDDFEGNVDEVFEQNPFQYEVQTENLLLSYTLGASMIVYIKDFVQYSKEKYIEQSIDQSQLSGNVIFKFNLDLSQVEDRFWTAGRIFYLPKLEYARNSVSLRGYILSNTQFYTINDKNYTEDKIKVELSPEQIALVAIGSILLVLAIVAIIIYCIRRRTLKKVKLSGNYPN